MMDQAGADQPAADQPAADQPATRGAESNAPAPLPRAALALRSEQAIASLYHRIASQRVREDPVALQFVSVDPASGTSAVASQFASYASRFHGGPALLVDCTTTLWPDGHAPRPGLVEAYVATGSVEAAAEPVAGWPGLHVAQLSSNVEKARTAGTEVFAAVLDEVRRSYRFTALDTPPLDESAYTLTFSRASDGVVLVLAANRTKWAQAEAAVEAIERSGGKILGFVFNKRRRYMPAWLHKRL